MFLQIPVNKDFAALLFFLVKWDLGHVTDEFINI